MSEIKKIIIASFIIISFILPSLNTAFGFTDAELSAKYSGVDGKDTLTNIQDAINNHSLQCSDLPPDIIAFNCPDTDARLAAAKANAPTDVVKTQSTTNGLDLSNILPVIGVILIPPIIIMVLMRLIHGGSSDNTDNKIDSTSSSKFQNVSMDNFKTKEDHPMGDKTHD